MQADPREQKESNNNAGVMLWVESRILPTRKGLRYPPRLPTELIHAMPADAAVPDKNAVGNDQNVEYPQAKPAVAMVSAENPIDPEMPGTAENANAIAPTAPAIATCQQRSRVTSE